MSEQIPEFSRPLSVARLPVRGIEEKLEAKPDERAALAQRFDVVQIPFLTAELTVEPKQQQTVSVIGRIRADITQNCVVTLEPLTTQLSIDVNVVFVPFEPGASEGEAGASFTDDLDEETETYIGGKIDLGEMVAQHLGINIDPYPRKPDAKLPATEFGGTEVKAHPFAKLAAVVDTGTKNKD